MRWRARQRALLRWFARLFCKQVTVLVSRAARRGWRRGAMTMLMYGRTVDGVSFVPFLLLGHHASAGWNHPLEHVLVFARGFKGSSHAATRRFGGGPEEEHRAMGSRRSAHSRAAAVTAPDRRWKRECACARQEQDRQRAVSVFMRVSICRASPGNATQSNCC